MDIGEAKREMEAGVLIDTPGWNGKGMFIFLVPESTITVTEGRPLSRALPVGEKVKCLPYIMMKTATGEIVPWNASQADLLRTDYRIYQG